MMSKKKNMLRNGILAGLATMFMAFGVGCGDDEPESQCEADQAYLVIGANPAQCYDTCEVGEDEVDPCGEGFACRPAGAVSVCRETSEPDPDPDPDPGACEAEVVCESYCQALYAGCVEEQCEAGATITLNLQDGTSETVLVSEFEVELCMTGLFDEDEAGNRVEIVPSCVERAANETVCEQLEAETENIVERGCSAEDGGRVFVCSELSSYVFTAGVQVFEQCGCEIAPISEACATAEDCTTDVYPGQCITENSGTVFPDGMCVAGCVPGEPGSLRADRNCGGDTGICFTSNEGGSCLRSCTDVADCPRGLDEGYGCLPGLELTNGQTIGQCFLAECTTENAETVCEEGQVCHTNGFCVNSCETDDECEEGQVCDTEAGSCDEQWLDLFASDEE
ncbi:hypothetical protein DV096_03635 [Bradymonadaceae bacterium TMQ3]|nr:hypothetical protein DV096_03635 [Bradymonadaceae bacterium TMQ3]TXC77587.1 hypothetical protein FRC91_02300 [Bradymonadales bacterium TMQ1]